MTSRLAPNEELFSLVEPEGGGHVEKSLHLARARSPLPLTQTTEKKHKTLKPLKRITKEEHDRKSDDVEDYMDYKITVSGAQ